MTSALLLLIFALLSASGLAAYIAFIGHEHDRDRLSFVLTFPSDVSAAQVLAALRPLSGFGVPSPFMTRSLAFEVVATPHSIQHRLHVPRPWVQIVRTHLVTAIPGLTIDPLATLDQPFTTGIELGVIGEHATLRTDNPEISARHLLAATQPLITGEILMLQWIVAPFGPGPRPIAGKPDLSLSGPWWRQFLMAFWRAGSSNAERVSLSTQRTKIAEPLFQVRGRIVATAHSSARARSLLTRLRVALGAVETLGAQLRPPSPFSWSAAVHARRRQTPFWWTAPVNAAELRAILAWPLNGPSVPGLVLRRSRLFPASSDLPVAGRIFGDGRDHGTSRPVAQPLDQAMTHTWLLGKTGVGKSTLIANLVLQDIAASSRPAVVVIEPKGDLCAEILTRIPEHRWDDLILLDAASDVLVGLNPLRLDEPDRELVADQVYGVFQQLSTNWGPRPGSFQSL